jgi:hypothetical protein
MLAAFSDIRAALDQWRLDFNGRRSANICGLFANNLRYDFRRLPEQDYSLLCNRLHPALGDTTRSFHYDLGIKEIIKSQDVTDFVLANARNGSNASVELSWHVDFTPDFGRMVAKQRTDDSGQEPASRAAKKDRQTPPLGQTRHAAPAAVGRPNNSLRDDRCDGASSSRGWVARRHGLPWRGRSKTG